MTYVSGVDTNSEFETRLIELGDWLSLDGYDVDFEVNWFDDYASLSVDVYVDGAYVATAMYFDQITKLIDRYFEERVDD